jgi:pyruvate/2-oxoglutarate dehydrogenase complex dihydrolipoamide dehydrogenase (E3) component
LRSRISHHDSAERFRELGVDVFSGQDTFIAANAIQVGGKVLPYQKAVIATGGRPAEPQIEGLKEAGYLINETIFSLTQRPRRLLILGCWLH